jgi:hypothetical protein
MSSLSFLFQAEIKYQENVVEAYPLNYELQRHEITLYNSKLGISCKGRRPQKALLHNLHIWLWSCNISTGGMIQMALNIRAFCLPVMSSCSFDKTTRSSPLGDSHSSWGHLHLFLVNNHRHWGLLGQVCHS